MKRAIALILCLFIASPVFGAVVYDSGGSGSVTGQPISLTTSITLGASVNAVYCGVGWTDSGSRGVSSYTYGGAAMTHVGTSNVGVDVAVAVYRKTAPATGAQDAVVTMESTGSNLAQGCVGLSGVDQGTPNGTAVDGSASADTISATIAIPANGAGIAFFVHGSTASCGSVSFGETERVDICDTDTNFGLAISTHGTSGSTAMDVTIGEVAFLRVVAVPINPAGRVVVAPIQFQ